MGFVYLIADDSGNAYKIGVTKSSINKRIKQLSIGNASELNTIGLYKTKYPFWIEKQLHKHFIKQHIRGEWYDLSDNDILQFNELCEKYNNIAESIKDNPYVQKFLH